MNQTVLQLQALSEADDFRYIEAIKTLRTNILLSGSNVRRILLSSTAPNEGKSTLSLALARAFAESGRRTLLLDADIRKSMFTVRHQIHRETIGLSQLLSGQGSLEDGIYTTNVENLDVILPGPYSPSPTELFEDEMCGKLFRYIEEQNYDFVIIDSPPLGSVIDAAILSRYADGAALVVESEVTTKRLFSRVKAQLDRTGVRFLGVILNRVKMDKGSYYGNYYGYYKKYGTYDYGPKNEEGEKHLGKSRGRMSAGSRKEAGRG